SMPIAGYVFVLDGVLMGAEDARYLALAQLVAVIGYAILLVPIVALWPTASGLWVAFCIGFVGFRALTLGWRVRNRAWIDRAVRSEERRVGKERTTRRRRPHEKTGTSPATKRTAICRTR